MGCCDGLAGWCRRSQTTRAWISPEQVSHSSVCTWIDAVCYPGSEQQNSPRLSAAPPYRSVWGWAILTLSAVTAGVWCYITDRDILFVNYPVNAATDGCGRFITWYNNAINTSQSWYTLSGHFIRDHYKCSRLLDSTFMKFMFSFCFSLMVLELSGPVI